MMDLLPEQILNKMYRYKNNLEYINSMKHINMFEQHYDDIPRYTKQVYGDKFPQIEMHIPIRKMLMPLQQNIIAIDTCDTTQFDGEYSLLYRGDKYMKIFEADMNVKIKVDSFNSVYGVNGGRRLYKFQIKWLNKHKQPLIGDIITIINRLRLESDYEKVHVIDASI